MSWRTTLTDPRQRLARYAGTAMAPDGPVALFTLASSKTVGLSMGDLGEAAEQHRLLGRAEIPQSNKNWITAESELVATGAFALHRLHGVEIDPRLHMPRLFQNETSLNPEGQKLYARLMRASGLKDMKLP